MILGPLVSVIVDVGMAVGVRLEVGVSLGVGVSVGLASSVGVSLGGCVSERVGGMVVARTGAEASTGRLQARAIKLKVKKTGIIFLIMLLYSFLCSLFR